MFECVGSSGAIPFHLIYVDPFKSITYYLQKKVITCQQIQHGEFELRPLVKMIGYSFKYFTDGASYTQFL